MISKIIAMLLLNLAIAGMVFSGTVMSGAHSWSVFITIELAQVLGVMQVLLYRSMK